MTQPYTRNRWETGAFMGRVATDRTTYRPLDEVQVVVSRKGSRACRIFVFDGSLNLYWAQAVQLKNGAGEISFPAQGMPGTHSVRVIFDQDIHRYLFFRMEPETYLDSGRPEFDALPVHLKAIADKCCAEVEVQGRKVSLSGRAGDNPMYIWFRDGGYGLMAYVYWHRYLKEFVDHFLASQDRDGFFKDMWAIWCREFSRCYGETDVEYIAVLVAHRVWQATGDDAWLKKSLARLERGIETSMRPHRIKRVKNKIGKGYLSAINMNCWDPASRLIKRMHSCDTWDFCIRTPDGKMVYVLAICDQSGFYRSAGLLAEMNRHFNRPRRAAHWQQIAQRFQRQSNKLLWDGVKYRHHRHLDKLDHGAFDEAGQLAMGNVWAINRGLADHSQSVSIIREYRRRWKRTGDKYPWWSLQPGYPDGSFNKVGSRKFWDIQQGYYANGGLIPWVGGELAKAALEHGFEEFGVQQLRLYAELEKRYGGGYTWYWLDGTPGHSSPDSTNHSIWDIGAWMSAVQEGLAGIRDRDKLFQQVLCAPRWIAAGVNTVRAVSAYPVSNAYFGYRQEWNKKQTRLRLCFSGTGDAARFRILLPPRRRVERVCLDGKSVPFRMERVESSRYGCFDAPIRRNAVTRSVDTLTKNFKENPMPALPIAMNRIEVWCT